jgi:hypothetical protein
MMTPPEDEFDLFEEDYEPPEEEIIKPEPEDELLEEE